MTPTLAFRRNNQKCNSEFTKKSHVAATLPQGYHHSIASCMALRSGCSVDTAEWLDSSAVEFHS